MLTRQLAELENAAEVGNFGRARLAAHNICGSAPSFGAAELDQLAKQLLLIGNDDNDLLVVLVEEVALEIEWIQAELGT